MRRYILIMLSLCVWNVTQGQTEGTCHYWFDSNYADRQTISLQDGISNAEIDVSGLTDAVHTVHFQLTDIEGAQSPVASHLFVKYPQKVSTPLHTSDGTCYYWFDTNYTAGHQMTLGEGATTLDVSHLSAGVHTIHFQGNGTAQTPTSSKLFVILLEKETANNKITGYDYWLNGTGTATSVTLPEPISPLSLVDLLPVASQPLRSSCFHFAVEEGQPTIYAKNDIRLRFYTSITNFADLTAQYVDYSVSSEVNDIKQLQPNVRQTENKPAANTIIWYQFTAEAGDVLRFHLDKAATIQVFSPTGQEVYSASGASAISWGETNAEETGTFYVALHDVTATKGTTVSIDYEHIDKYAVLSQDVAAVGNGGPSTITFQGNGFDELTSIDLIQGTTTIGSAEISNSGKATVSAKFNFEEVPLGDYKAVFHFQEEDLTVEDCVSVEQAVPVSVSSTVGYTQNFLLSRGNDYVFKLKNLGNMTAYNMPIQLRVYTTDASNLTMISVDGNVLDDYTEELESTVLVDYPYMRCYNLARTLRPSATEPLVVRVKTARTERIYVYLDEVGGPSDPVASVDPNDIYGYQDETGDKTLPGGQTDVFYTIEFENDPSFATAPAHDIYVTDQLNPSLFDLQSFAPTRVRIGNKEAELTGGQSGTVTISMLPEIYAIAQVEWSLDAQTGLLTWHISSLDPMTVEPTDDVMSGVLPVNTDGDGIGELSFDISLQPNLAAGTEIPNKATIVFDENDAIETPTWTNVIGLSPNAGDVNGDGIVNLTDALWIVRQFVGRTPENIDAGAADANGDGSVNLSDALKVVRVFVGKENTTNN